MSEAKPDFFDQMRVGVHLFTEMLERLPHPTDCPGVRYHFLVAKEYRARAALQVAVHDEVTIDCDALAAARLAVAAKAAPDGEAPDPVLACAANGFHLALFSACVGRVFEDEIGDTVRVSVHGATAIGRVWGPR